VPTDVASELQAERARSTLCRQPQQLSFPFSAAESFALTANDTKVAEASRVILRLHYPVSTMTDLSINKLC
jgi:hypothetical protein